MKNGTEAGNPGAASSALALVAGAGYADGEPSTDTSTRDRVFAELLAAGPISTSTLAARLNLTAPAVRRHVEALETEGLIVARDQVPRTPRGRGRPAQVYVVTDAGRALYRKDYGELALQAIDELVDAVGPAGLDRLAARHFSPIGEQFNRLVAQGGEPDGATALADALDQAGYVASLTPSPMGEQLCQHHCPVADVARAYPQLCEIETDLIGRLLGSHVQRLATIAHGDGVCTTHIPAISTQAGRTAGKASMRIREAA